MVAGSCFLIVYWVFGYDGITFSDEVSYLQLGHKLWNQQPVLTDYHFTSRWGAFLFSGFFTHIFGFSDRAASIATLIFYLLTLYVVWSITPEAYKKLAVLFFVTHVYLLHFLSKVYPDGFLLLWTILIPAAAIWRSRKPVLAALVMALAFFIGFCTKETIVLLAPFPLLLLVADIRSKKRLLFYYSFAAFVLLIAVMYLGYYQWKCGDWAFRFKTIENGHYSSLYSFYDKSQSEILKRISYLPIIRMIERTYWLWVTLAIPGIFYGIMGRYKILHEFALTSLTVIIGFWWTTTSFQFYSPLPLNPRHLIILIAPLSVCIAIGSYYWQSSRNWRAILAITLFLGGIYAIAYIDWKVGAFYGVFAALLFLKNKRLQFATMAVALLIPAMFSISYQHRLKNYPQFLEVFKSEARKATKQAPLLTHDFVYFSREILLEEPDTPAQVLSLLEIDSLQANPPGSFTLFIYKYYQHAYPLEQEVLDHAKKWIDSHYVLIQEEQYPQISVKRFRIR